MKAFNIKKNFDRLISVFHLISLRNLVQCILLFDLKLDILPVRNPPELTKEIKEPWKMAYPSTCIHGS